MVITDQTGRKLNLEKVPVRVVSCVPSISELIYDLTSPDVLVGCTKFCIFPEELRKNCIIIGGTKNLRIDAIRDLNPDLVIVNKEENVKEQVEELMEGFPVYVSDVKNFDDGIMLIKDLAQMLGVEEAGETMCEEIENRFREIQNSGADSESKEVVYFIWRNPWMTIGGDTYINDILKKAGYKNMFSNLSRYPEISLDQLKNHPGGEILLSSEPYPFGEKDRDFLEDELPQWDIKLVDGSMFSWYGSRMLKAADYLASL